jgi:GAF domain-containing protein
LAALDRIAQLILDGRDSDEVFDAIAREALEIVVAMGVTIGMPTPDGTGIVLRAAVGELTATLRTEGVARGSVVPIEGAFMGHAIREGRMLVSRDASLEPPGRLREAARRSGLGPIVAIPLAVRERTLGGLAVVRPVGSPPFSRSDIQVVRTFAAQASVAATG